ncbi:MAG: hypothetical protein AB1705_05035 [Verrucomicrobiota bacterium]
MNEIHSPQAEYARRRQRSNLVLVACVACLMPALAIITWNRAARRLDAGLEVTTAPMALALVSLVLLPLARIRCPGCQASLGLRRPRQSQNAVCRRCGLVLIPPVAPDVSPPSRPALEDVQRRYQLAKEKSRTLTRLGFDGIDYCPHCGVELNATHV